MCFGGGSSTQTQKTELPAWLEGFGRDTLGMADQVTRRPYQAYPGPRIARAPQQTKQARNLATQSVGQWTGVQPGGQQGGGAGGWNEQAYLQANPDVAAAVQQGGFDTGRQHFRLHGMQEGRQPGMAANLAGAMDATAGVMSGQAQAATVDRGGIRDVDAVDFDRSGVRDLEAERFTDANIDAYMNPYTENVQQETLREMQRQHNIASNQLQNQFAAAGAHGGSQQALAQTESLRNFSDMVGLHTARLQDQAFQQAQQQIARDQDRALQAMAQNQGVDAQAMAANQQAAMQAQQLNQGVDAQAAMADQQAQQQINMFNPQQRLAAAQQLGGLAGQGQQMQHQDIAMLEGVGRDIRMDDQMHADLAYQDWLRQWNYPLDMLNVRTSLASGQPHGQATTGPGPNNFAQNLGAFGALAGGIGMLSDRRLKRDIERAGTLPSGLPVYRFKYLWEDTERLGVIADEVEVLFPEAVSDVGGYKAVNYAEIG